MRALKHPSEGGGWGTAFIVVVSPAQVCTVMTLDNCESILDVLLCYDVDSPSGSGAGTPPYSGRIWRMSGAEGGSWGAQERGMDSGVRDCEETQPGQTI